MKTNFDLLKEYFNNTPKEIILKEWEATKEFDKVGPSAKKFNTMKTIKQWLKEGLSEDDYKMAEKYEDEDWKEEIESFKRALSRAFVWGDTQGGHDYWRKIHNNGGSLQTNTT